MERDKKGQTMTTEDKDRRIADLEAQLAEKSKLSIKLSAKGAISVYGLQRFPVSLYAEQWQRVIEFAPKIQEFIAKNLPLINSITKR